MVDDDMLLKKSVIIEVLISKEIHGNNPGALKISGLNFTWVVQFFFFHLTRHLPEQISLKHFKRTLSHLGVREGCTLTVVSKDPDTMMSIKEEGFSLQSILDEIIALQEKS
jgi:hypothetical protein